MTLDKVVKLSPAHADIMHQVAMRSKAHWGYSEEFMLQCREELSYPASRFQQQEFYGVFENGESLAGIAGALDNKNNTFEVTDLFVLPKFIGTGLGTHLFKFLRQRVIELGGKELQVQSDPNAEVFYQKVGFNTVSRTESVSVPGRYLPFMKMKLPSKT
ncbi:GNAT family N-acetyltransferase [Aliikangiella coralliicola]|uniref:GNAT family N-acetyltransferase n=1 Tax=Aliikangiella coralliicola TaxID=2592383 RepID=A0A545UIK4_9GAMM|nr:GNAT family N-acetyltransferase [Aliikangiella coralliicola]TQV89297.1 GNAT family N-acetyltransferase [Aliikangiella coralliicola]